MGSMSQPSRLLVLSWWKNTSFLSSVSEETEGLLPLCRPSLPWGPKQFACFLLAFRDPGVTSCVTPSCSWAEQRQHLDQNEVPLLPWPHLFLSSQVHPDWVQAPSPFLLLLWL